MYLNKLSGLIILIVRNTNDKMKIVDKKYVNNAAISSLIDGNIRINGP